MSDDVGSAVIGEAEKGQAIIRLTRQGVIARGEQFLGSFGSRWVCFRYTLPPIGRWRHEPQSRDPPYVHDLWSRFSTSDSHD